MDHLFHLAFLGRSARQVGGAIEYLDGLPVPTKEELSASRAAAEAAWAAEQAAAELPARRAQMADLLAALPIETQAALWATRVAVEQALDRGRLDIARALVQATVVPPELEDTKAAILDLFPV
jgi:hypothetical protein